MQALLRPPHRPPSPAVLPPSEAPRLPRWWRPEEEWDRLEPQGWYARWVRTPLLYSVALLLAPWAAALAVPVALANLLAHRSLRRVLFLQERVGRRGRVFVLYKFRTMRGGPGEGEDRERVTRLGRFLRNTHLDELPQFWNVLRGDMALVGPRPEMLSIEAWAAECLPRFAERLVLRPGLTGWAQITQGYAADGDEVAYARKQRINRVYLRRLSLGTDLKVLLATVGWVLRRRGWRPAPRTERNPSETLPEGAAGEAA